MSGPTNNGRRRVSSAKKAPARKAGKARARGGAGGGPGRGKGRKQRPPRTWKQRLKRIALWTTAAGLALALIGAGVFFVLYKTIDIPNPNEDFQTETTYVYWQDGEAELGRFSAQNRTSIDLEEMPDSIKDAVVAAENRSFWTDNGIDPKGILRAAFSNLSSDTTQGASTITQQYIKILYLTQERSYSRKAKEALLSLKIHNQLSKEEILEGYLNTIYFGRGAYGIEEAAQAYFDVPAAKLNLRQSAVLASVLNNPYRFDPANGEASREVLRKRYEWVISSMLDMGVIEPDDAAWASERLPKFPRTVTDDRLGGQKGHALTLVKSELQQLGFTPEQIEGGGLRVTTTFDKKAMSAAEQGVMEAKPEVPQPKKLHVGVASVDVATGALRGFYGGQDYLQSQINWAATGGMVGSTMKPVAAVAAMESGFELNDTFEGNSPYTYPNGETVVNSGEAAGYADGHDYGRVSLIRAMEESVNTAFIDMTVGMGADGPKKIHDAGLRMGVTPMKADREHRGIPATSGDFDPTDARISLGKAVVSPINMANTFATLANRGVHNDVYTVDKVVDRNGTVLYEHRKNPERVVQEGIADDVSYTLQQTADEGTGSANASSADNGRPVAGKTGTATKENGRGGTYVSSSWYVGYTPQLATAVMYVRGDGNDQLDDWMPSYYGASYPATTFTSVMTRAMDGREAVEFPEPAWVDGEAPSSGYAPAPVEPEPEVAPAPRKPDPKPTRKAEPKPQPTPTNKPMPTPTPTPSKKPSPTPSSTAPTEPTASPCLVNCPDDPEPEGEGEGEGEGKPDKKASAGAQRAFPGWAVRDDAAVLVAVSRALRTWVA